MLDLYKEVTQMLWLWRDIPRVARVQPETSIKPGAPLKLALSVLLP